MENPFRPLNFHFNVLTLPTETVNRMPSVGIHPFDLPPQAILKQTEESTLCPLLPSPTPLKFPIPRTPSLLGIKRAISRTPANYGEDHGEEKHPRPFLFLLTLPNSSMRIYLTSFCVLSCTRTTAPSSTKATAAGVSSASDSDQLRAPCCTKPCQQDRLDLALRLV